MTTEVEFLLLNSDNQWATVAISSLVQLYAEFDSVLVMADKRQTLVQLDELLWHKSSEQFIPHSLNTECFAGSTSVLLTDQHPVAKRYRSLLNIDAEISARPEQFRSIIELVQADEKSKEKARERYKLYRQQGFIVSHKECKQQ